MATIALGLILLFSFIGYQIWYHSFTELDLAELTSISFYGYDGKGSAEATLERSLEDSKILETVHLSLDKSDGLSNGDRLIVRYEYDKDLAKALHYRVKDSDYVITIEDLEIPTRVSLKELFDCVELSQDGISPVMTVQVSNRKTSGFLSTVVFSIENEKDFYEAGDVVTVIADFDEQEAITQAYDLQAGEKGYRKDFVLECEDSYLTSAELITDEMLKEMIQAGGRLIQQDDPSVGGYGLRIFSEAGLKPQWIGRKTTFVWGNPRILSAYFCVVTDEAKGLLETHVNDVRLVYEATLSQQDGVSCQAEIVVQYTNLIERAGQTIDLELDSGKIAAVSHRNANIKKLVDDEKEVNYHIVKLDLN